MWAARNKCGTINLSNIKPTRYGDYWKTIEFHDLEFDFKYDEMWLLDNPFPNLTWEDEPKRVCLCLDNRLEDIDDEPIYMIAESERGERDWYSDFNYGYCPLEKYANNSTITEYKTLSGSSHGYGCPGYVIKTTMKYLKMMGWESDYEKYKTTEDVWIEKYKYW